MADVKNHSTLPTNLGSYWELEEASGTRVDSHGGNDLTDNNTVTQGTGIQGSCADIEAANNEYLSNAAPSGFTSITNCSVSMWIKKESAGTMFLFFNGTASVAAFSMYISATGEVPVLSYAGVGRTGTTGVSLATWSHLVFVHDATANIDYIYVDGVESDNFTGATTDPSDTASDVLHIGMHGNGTSNDYDGLIDEVGYWDKALTSAEVSDLYNSGAGIPYEGLVTFIPKVLVY